MKNRLRVISFLLCLALIASLGYVSFSAEISEFLMAVPQISGGTGIPIKSLEEVNERGTTLTYENIYDRTVRALQSNYSVVLKGTNCTYPYVMNYSITNGGFFTEEAFENKNRVVVLNEKAAFDIFGTLEAVGNTLQIDMKPYAVTGVINDNDADNLNVFIPATCLSETAGTITSSLSDGLTEEHIKNQLKHIGISETKYYFINLKLLTNAIRDKLIASLEIILFGMLLLSAKKLLELLYRKFNEIKQLRQQLYFKEMLKDEERPIHKFALILTSATIIIIAELSLILHMVEKLLSWNSLAGIFNDISYESFSMIMARTEKAYILSNGLFIGFAVVFGIFLITAWESNTNS